MLRFALAALVLISVGATGAAAQAETTKYHRRGGYRPGPSPTPVYSKYNTNTKKFGPVPCKSSAYTCYNIRVQVVNTYHNQNDTASQENTGWLTLVGSPDSPVGRYNNVVFAVGPQPGLPAAWTTGVFVSTFEFSLELNGLNALSVQGKVTSDENFATQDLDGMVTGGNGAFDGAGGTYNIVPVQTDTGLIFVATFRVFVPNYPAL